MALLPILMLCLTTKAQRAYFYSLNDTSKDIVVSKVQANMNDSVVSNTPDSTSFGNIEKPLALLNHKSCSRSSHKEETCMKFYNGASHELTMMNVLQVMEEVGVSNRLIVLAQSLLETGFYKSNVCKTKNNLFGLRHPRTGAYMKFERWEDSVIGYKKFVQYKYKEGNYFSFLKRIGYAEDPRYIYKVAKITKQLATGEKLID